MNVFEVLRNQKILSILVGEIESNDIVMPYINIDSIRNLFLDFGFSIDFETNGFSSRIYYLDKLLERCINTNNVPQLLDCLFDKKRFEKKSRYYQIPKLDACSYENAVNTIINSINQIIQLSGHKLIFTNGIWDVKLHKEINLMSNTLEQQIDTIEEKLAITGNSFSTKGRIDCQQWIREFGFDEVCTSVDIALCSFANPTL